MKLKTQIFLGFLFILILTLILSSVFVYYLENLGQSSDKILRENYRSVKASEELTFSLSKIDQILAKICLGKNYNDKILLDIVANETALFRSNLEISKKNISEVGEGTVVNSIQEEFEAYVTAIGLFSTSPDRVTFYFNKLQRQNEQIRESCINLINLNHEAMSRRDTITQDLYFQAKIYVFIVTVMVLLLAGITIFKIPQMIVQPIIDVTEKINRITAGEYDQKVEVDSHNELGDLIKAFNMMSVKLKELEEINYAEIKAQKSRIESIIRSINDGLIILNENSEIILVNTSGSMILNTPEENLIGKKAVDIASENPVMKDLLFSINNSGDNNPGATSDVNYNSKNFLKIVNDNDSQEFFTKEIVKVYDNNAFQVRKFLGYIIMLKDVTSYKKSDEAKTNFIAVVSHELKTPLSAMNMSLMLLQDDRFGFLNDEQTKIASSMKNEVQRLIKMVTELLDFSKVETGDIGLDMKLVPPELLVEYSTAPIELQIKEKDITIHKFVEKNLPDVLVDPEKISWVLINFLSNAVRYSPPASEIQVEVCAVGQEYLEFRVIDKGPGIQQENLSKVFNKFVQIPSNGKKNKSGLGLGLAISKEVIDAHSGQIGVRSEFGNGCCFYFQLPLPTKNIS